MVVLEIRVVASVVEDVSYIFPVALSTQRTTSAAPTSFKLILVIVRVLLAVIGAGTLIISVDVEKMSLLMKDIPAIGALVRCRSTGIGCGIVFVITAVVVDVSEGVGAACVVLVSVVLLPKPKNPPPPLDDDGPDSVPPALWLR